MTNESADNCIFDRGQQPLFLICSKIQTQQYTTPVVGTAAGILNCSLQIGQTPHFLGDTREGGGGLTLTSYGRTAREFHCFKKLTQNIASGNNKSRPLLVIPMTGLIVLLAKLIPNIVPIIDVLFVQPRKQDTFIIVLIALIRILIYG